MDHTNNKTQGIKNFWNDSCCDAALNICGCCNDLPSGICYMDPRYCCPGLWKIPFFQRLWYTYSDAIAPYKNLRWTIAIVMVLKCYFHLGYTGDHLFLTYFATLLSLCYTKHIIEPPTSELPHLIQQQSQSILPTHNDDEDHRPYFSVIDKFQYWNRIFYTYLFLNVAIQYESLNIPAPAYFTYLCMFIAIIVCVYDRVWHMWKHGYVAWGVTEKKTYVTKSFNEHDNVPNSISSTPVPLQPVSMDAFSSSRKLIRSRPNLSANQLV